MGAHLRSTRIHLKTILEQNVGVEFDVRKLADMVEDSRGLSTDITNIYSAIKFLRDMDGMKIVLVSRHVYKYIE